MNHNENKIEKKKNGTSTGIAGSVLGLVAYSAMKALADKETREKIIDTFFEIKKKLSNSTRDAKIENSDETNLKNVNSTGS